MRSLFPRSYLRFFPVPLIFLFFGGLIYARALGYPFVHDDVIYIVDNPHIADLSGLWHVFTAISALPHLTKLANPYYRPILEVAYRLQFAVFGYDPAGYHLVNILLHIGNSILVWLLLRAVVRSPGVALAVALMFLVHPVQTEAVIPVAGISNLLFSFFLLASFLCYRRATEPPGERPVVLSGMFWASMGLYILAVLSKEQAVVLPGLIVLYEGVFGRRRFGHRQRVTLTGYVLLTAAYLWWRKILLGSAVVPSFVFSRELLLRVEAIPRTLLMDMRILLWPVGLHYYRSIDILRPLGLSVWIFAGIVLLLAVGIGRLPRPDRRVAVFGVGWFLITLLPVLNIVPLINEYSLIAAFEHFLYLPLIGFFLTLFVLVRAGLETAGEHAQAVGATALAAVVIVCMFLTVSQSSVWRGEIPLFQRVVRYEPQFGRARLLLGDAYLKAGEPVLAVGQFDKAIGIMQGYIARVRDPLTKTFYRDFVAMAHQQLAKCFLEMGALGPAAAHDKACLAIHPKDGKVYNHLGVVYARMHRMPAAKRSFQRALELAPGDARAMSNLAVCDIQEGHPRRAEKLLRRALRVAPGLETARRNLERLLRSSATGFAPEGDGKKEN